MEIIIDRPAARIVLLLALACLTLWPAAGLAADAAALDRPGSLIEGFKLLRCDAVPEIGARPGSSSTSKRGPRLLYLSNSDDNKVF